ncbi:hypothetical protein NR798_25210 [Archangium gephyra]|uniref:phosphoribosyltransferase-like protein n=1 Tax=Archangium gephyra TaxID=48 RepID=UPI0035D52563
MALLLRAMADGVDAALTSYERQVLEGATWTPNALSEHLKTSRLPASDILIHGTLTPATPLDPGRSSFFDSILAGSSITSSGTFLHALVDTDSLRNTGTAWIPVVITRQDFLKHPALSSPRVLTLRGTLCATPESWLSVFGPSAPRVMLTNVVLVDDHGPVTKFSAPIWLVASPTETACFSAILEQAERLEAATRDYEDETAKADMNRALRALREPHLFVGHLLGDTGATFGGEFQGYAFARNGEQTLRAFWPKFLDTPGLRSACTNWDLEALRRRQLDEIRHHQISAGSDLVILVWNGDGSYWCSVGADLANPASYHTNWSELSIVPWGALRTIIAPLWRVSSRGNNADVASQIEALRDTILEQKHNLVPATRFASSSITPVIFHSDQLTRPIAQRLVVSDILIKPPGERGAQLIPNDYREPIETLFERFRSHDLKISPEDIWRFIRQCRVDKYAECMLELLRNVDLLDRARFESLLKMGWDQLPKSVQDEGVCINLGGPGDSSSIMNNYLSHHAHIRTRHAELREWLERAPERPGIFVDDCSLSGTQAIRLLREMVGQSRKPPKTVQPLPAPLVERFTRATKYILYATATEFAVKRITEDCSTIGLDIKIVRGRVEPVNKIFDNAVSGTAWPPDFPRFCRQVGASILAGRAERELWPEARLHESALGFSDFQKTLVFHYNTPKTTLTLLWERGSYRNQPWEPLFPARDN